ncbi:TPA: phage tail protein [Salmonella enterica subsp. enterica serovar Manhattan]|nr:phage tail protein [Salmonella enterica subsp. enterica serovar Manhattan]
MPAFPKFKTIITDYGKQRLIAAMSPGGTKLTLTQMAVGDGGGNPTNPDTTSTALVNEVWRAAVNSVTADKKHPNIIIVELLIPAEVGGFWVREAGIYDEFNKLVAICSLPASEKPLLEQGSGRAQTVRMTLVISDMSTINITIDSTTIIATNDYVDNSLKEHEKSRNHPDATLTAKGFVKLYSGVTSIDETMAATPKAVKIAMDNASARLAKERNLADLTNIPLARQSLQLGNSATLNVGTTANTVAAGDDSRITGAMQKSQNGGDIPDKKQFARTIGAVTSTTITLGESGWFKIATVVMPQSTSTVVIKLYGGAGFNVGAFETAAISELVLRSGNGSPAGIIATLWKRSPNGVLECAWINTSGDTYDIYINIGQYAYWLIAQYDYTGNANVTLHSTPEYSSVQPGSSTSGQTYTLYNSLMKPTAGDVEALSLNGGRLNGALGIGTDNALGGNSIVLGDNDTGIKWHSDGVLGIYANNALVGYIDNSGLHMSVDVLTNGGIRAGDGKRLSLTSSNSSTLNAGFNLWGDANRPTVIELDDNQGWHLYSQRNPDGSIVFTVNGDITANTLRAGGAIYQNNGDIYGSVWGNNWLSTWIHNNVVRGVRLGPVALSGGLWRDFQLGGGQVVTGFHTDGSWEMEGDDDKVYYRPVQYLVGDTWITASSV